ncbi:extracellular solute-binding protein [Faecalibacterium prausnitzii]|uniref:extracellular solute-binding protein n=1 Tax=Faecalibacterium TaxID=216851 RepID=UPI0032AFFA3F
MKNHIKSLLCGLCAAALALGCAGCSGSAGPEVPAKVTDIMVWTYYNGDQLESFTSLVNQFNETVGAQKGIKVSTESQGSVNDLETSVMDSAEGKVGAAAMPNIFSAYADTAYALDQMGMVVDLAPCLTEEEKAQFVEGYLSEGGFGEDDSIKIFPVAKSTELLFLNDTDWQAFADATDVRYEDLATMEGLTAAAEKYYNWTDAQTAAPDDGKALFGRDAMANYMLVGAQQLGDTIFAVKDGRMTVNFERDVARRLWDNYYVPFVRGWFAATGRFRSDDIKTGNVLAYVGSSSSATFFPTRVTNDANESHEISLRTLPAPQFEGGEAVAVQQGAGMVVTAAKEEEVEASVEFLKWFVRAENNIAFSVGSGYLPVTRKANDMQEILASGLTLDDNMQQTLEVAVDTVNGNRLYTPHAFAGSNSARKVLEYGLSDLAAADRETVVQRIAEGRSAAEAEAEFLTDEYFEAWYQDICAKLARYEG